MVEWLLLALRILIAAALFVFFGTVIYLLVREPSNGLRNSEIERARLVQTNADGETQRSIELSRATWIGRNPNCAVHIEDEFVSSRHAQLIYEVEDRAWWIEDNASRNGTVVNDTSISRKRLAHGDVIRIGEARFRFSEQLKDKS
jgi:pSer/pThr/pTyr-binding forkhead associated (FHA) protein